MYGVPSPGSLVRIKPAKFDHLESLVGVISEVKITIWIGGHWGEISIHPSEIIEVISEAEDKVLTR